MLEGGTTGDVSLSVDPAKFQVKVSGTCPAGESISIINDDGTVVCEKNGKGDGNSLDSADGNKKDIVFVNNGGNVGIGVTSPQGNLHVVSSGGADANFYVESNANPGKRVGLAFNNANPFGSLQSYDYNLNAGLPLLLNASGGNVGIGMTNPSNKLSVSGIVESISGGFKFPDGTTQATASAGSSSVWSTSGSNTYYNSGNVGVGTTNPGYNLEVLGATAPSSVIVIYTGNTRGGL